MRISITNTNIHVVIENSNTVSHAKKEIQKKYNFNLDQIFIYDDFAFQTNSCPDSIEVGNLVNPRIFIKPIKCDRHELKVHSSEGS